MIDDTLGGIPEEFMEEVAKLVPEIYKDAGQPALRKLGKTAGLLWDSCVYLRAAIYAARTRARLLPRLQKYLNEIAAIKDENLCEVPPEIGVPILERLSYVADNDIADLFIRLLTTASSDETNSLAHPRFVNLIDSISPDEAKMLIQLKEKEKLWILRSDSEDQPGVYMDLSDWAFSRRAELKFPHNMTLYFENLISLGILDFVAKPDTVFQSQDLLDPQKLQTLQEEGLPEISEAAIAALVQMDRDSVTVDHYTMTEFGRMFANACTAKLPVPED